MSEEFDQEKLQALAAEIAKGIKSEADLASFSRQLVKATVESALNAELSEHLGYERHGRSDNNPGNSRNGYSSKTLKGEVGEVEVQTPRDRNGTFEPHLIKKGQTRFTEFDDQILALYAKGMSTRDIVAAFKEMYGAEVSATLISKVTDTVLETVQEWQARPLDGVYPIVYLDGIVVKVRHDKRVINKAIYLALGVNLDGQKELLGLWIGESEGAKFWLGVLTELKNRGLEDILIACTDGLTAFPRRLRAYIQRHASSCASSTWCVTVCAMCHGKTARRWLTIYARSTAHRRWKKPSASSRRLPQSGMKNIRPSAVEV